MSDQPKIKATKSKSNKGVKSVKSDALFKSIMEDELAAREFLDHYLPVSFKCKLDLSTITVEKESFVEDSLKRRLSDVIYRVKTKDNEDAFVFC